MIKITATIWLILFVLAPQGFAQEQNDMDRIGGLEIIRSKLLEANEKSEKLKAENAGLQAKLTDLRREVELSEKELRDLERKYPDRVRADREQSAIGSDPAVELAVDDPYIAEAQELYLSGQMLALSDEQKLRELYLYDLQYRKQELQLDLAELEAQREEMNDKRAEELQAMESEIEDIIAEENQVKAQIKTLEREVSVYPREIDLLKIENENLESKIKRLKR